VTPKERAIWQQLANSKAYLDTAADTLKYLSFEKLTLGGVARCNTIEANLGFVTGTLNVLLNDLETGRFPFREAQVATPDRQGSAT